MKVLSEILAELYSDDGSIRLFLRQVGIDFTRIDLNGSVQVAWGNIIDEIAKHKKIRFIVEKAADDYPEFREDLDQAAQPYFPRQEQECEGIDVRNGPDLECNSTISTPDIELSGTDKILQIVNLMFRKKVISFDEKIFLNHLFQSVSPNTKTETPRGDYMFASPSLSDDAVGQASKVLAHLLTSLSEYHPRWTNLMIGDSITRDSLSLLRGIRKQVEMILQQNPNEKSESKIEAERILETLRTLKLLFIDLDKYLISGTVPYTISSDIESSFKDLVFYVSKYLLLVNGVSKRKNALDRLQ